MATFELDYALLQIQTQDQTGKLSLARKSHRRDGGNPTLTVDPNPGGTSHWVIEGLGDGEPEVVPGQARTSHLDFYMLLDDFHAARSAFPAAGTAPNSALESNAPNPHGTERVGGKSIKMDMPMHAYAPVGPVRIEFAGPPHFDGSVADSTLYVDFETAPSIGADPRIPEIHFGVALDGLALTPAAAFVATRVKLEIPSATYATLRARLIHL